MTLDMLPAPVYFTAMTFGTPHELEAIRSTSSFFFDDDDGVLSTAWGKWSKFYGVGKPSHRYPAHRDVVVRRKNFASTRLCIGTRTNPGCWKRTTGEHCNVSRAFNEPRRCRSCETASFVAATTAQTEMRAWLKANNVSRTRRKEITEKFRSEHASAKFRRVATTGGLTQGMYARRGDFTFSDEQLIFFKGLAGHEAFDVQSPFM